MRTYIKSLYIQKLTLFSLMILSSKLQADLASIINGGDASKNLVVIHTLVDQVKTTANGLATSAEVTTLGTSALATAANLATLQTTANGLATSAEVTTLGTSALATAAIQGTQGTSIDAILVDTAVIGTATNTGGTATIGAILGDAANISLAARLTTIDTIVDDILVDTGTTIPGTITTMQTDVSAILVDTAVIGTATNTGGTATIGGILGNPGASIGVASMAVALAYVMANIQASPVTQVNTAKGLTELTTTVTLAGTPAAQTTTDVGTYNTNIATAITAATTATTQATQTRENTTTAITNLNTAITNFDTFIASLVADAGYPATVYINSAGGGEASIKWALDQLLWSLQQLQANQTADAA